MVVRKMNRQSLIPKLALACHKVFTVELLRKLANVFLLRCHVVNVLIA